MPIKINRHRRTLIEIESTHTEKITRHTNAFVENKHMKAFIPVQNNRYTNAFIKIKHRNAF